MEQRSPSFFDIPLNRLTPAALQTRLRDILDGADQHLVATPNPEMLLTASYDESVARTLRRFHLRIPDGVGLSIMSTLTRQGRLERFPGVDVFLDICKLAAARNMHVLLLGGWGSDGAVAGRVLEAAFPGLRVSTLGDMQIRFEDGLWEQPSDLMERIEALQPDIIGVALGGSHHDRQERWIVDHASRLPSIKLLMGIGGGVDMISGRTPRAPKWIRFVGGEWLWRLTHDPRRAGRIFNAVVRFPARVLLDRMQGREL